MPLVCTKCENGPIVIQRTYSGEALCRKCFLRAIESKASKTMSKYKMIKHGDKIAVGVSGGKDSLSLLYVLKRYFEAHRANNNELVAITIDEGIDGYRNESLDIVSQVCRELGIESEVFSYKRLFGISMDEAMTLRPSDKVSSCSICGTFRRRALDIAAESLQANVLATAHNLDDHLQTFMINVLAGDVDRIGWTHPSPVQYGAGLRKIKPFTEIPEYEIAFYALQQGLPFQSEQCPYMDESIRTDIREFFNELESKHPGVKFNAYNSTVKVASAMRQESCKKENCTKCGRDSSGPICSACKMVELLVSNKQI